uniref:Uncharacterized protein n=1 Tax=Rhizophora mucronata TaxID=61149 RepID=A0A2P2NLL5_RHIMU
MPAKAQHHTTISPKAFMLVMCHKSIVIFFICIANHSTGVQ